MLLSTKSWWEPSFAKWLISCVPSVTNTKNEFTKNREAVELSLRKLDVEEAAKAKKGELAVKLQAELNAGGGYVKTPLIRNEYTEDEQAALRGLEVHDVFFNAMQYSTHLSG